VASTVGEGALDALALGLGTAEAVEDSGVLGEGDVAGEEQAARIAPVTSTLAHRRTARRRPRLTACCRCDPG
jgi:hypothetical protein